MSPSSTIAVSRKVAARTDGVRIDNICNAFLHNCFKQFGIHIVPLPGDPVGLLQRQKFEACLLRNMRAFLTWERQEREKEYVLRLDPREDSRVRVRSWIDQSLEIT